MPLFVFIGQNLQEHFQESPYKSNEKKRASQGAAMPYVAQDFGAMRLRQVLVYAQSFSAET